MSLLDKSVIMPVQDTEICFYSEIAIPFIQLALERTDGETSLESILSDIANRTRQLWVIKDQDEYIAAVVTMIYTTQTGFKIGEVSFAGGRDQEKWDHFVDVVGQWFKEQGCKFIDIIGRPGWHRLYEKRGFTLLNVQLRRGL